MTDETRTIEGVEIVEGITEGEWYVSDHGSPIFVRAKIDRDGATFSKTVCHVSETIYDKPMPARANARLIAQAPQMQQALIRQQDEIKRLRDKLESHAPDGHNVTNGQYVELARKAREQQERIEEYRNALEEIAHLVITGHNAKGTLARIALSLSGMEEAGMIHPERQQGAEETR